MTPQDRKFFWPAAQKLHFSGFHINFLTFLGARPRVPSMLLVLECGGGGSTKVKNLKRVRMKKILGDVLLACFGGEAILSKGDPDRTAGPPLDIGRRHGSGGEARTPYRLKLLQPSLQP